MAGEGEVAGAREARELPPDRAGNGHRQFGCCTHRVEKNRRAMKSDLTGELLKNVSRSFYLTLRALPRGLREPIGLAYLLARASDTVADSSAAPVEIRLKNLA